MKNFSLHIPPQMWQNFCQTLFKARSYNEEVIGFFFCQRQQLNEHQIRYFPKSWVVPYPDCYEHQSSSGLVLKQPFHQYLLENQLGDKKLDVLHIHTHIGQEMPYFSSIDDIYESEYAQFLSTNFTQKPQLISGVFNYNLQQGKFRMWNHQGDSFVPVNFSHSWFQLPVINNVNSSKPLINNNFSDTELSNDEWDEPELITNNFSDTELINDEWDELELTNNNYFAQEGVFNSNFSNNSYGGQQLINDNYLAQTRSFQSKFSNNGYGNQELNNETFTHHNLMFNRQKIFGDTVQKQLGELKVTLIGCGGIGSIFAETLGRLGVKKWTLIDPDKLEFVNLNRMIASTPLMVEKNCLKVDYIKDLISKIYPTDSVIKTIPKSIENEAVIPAILDSDLIVVATDNHHSRQIAQELALKYMRPLVCLGTHIEIKADNTPRMYCRITIPPLGGDWCLMCGNVIDLQRVALETAPTEIHQLAEKAGYLEGIEDPAVLWLNTICASTAVGIIHGMISGFINVDEGLDWIYDFTACNWLKTNPESLVNTDCYFCSDDTTSCQDHSQMDFLQK